MAPRVPEPYNRVKRGREKIGGREGQGLGTLIHLSQEKVAYIVGEILGPLIKIATILSVISVSIVFFKSIMKPIHTNDVLISGHFEITP